VHVFGPDGTLIGKIHLPEAVSNLCFGGVKRNRLFITASQSVYALYVEAQGVPFPWDAQRNGHAKTCNAAG
jgi:gluconolactonase